MSRRALLTWLALGTIVTLLLVHSVRRDIRYNQEYPGDLRNRIVGARLVEDGRDPYFYKWKRTDGIRYYDTENFGPGIVSPVTVSPFFLHVLRPIADWPEATIDTWWLVLQYLSVLVMTVICFFVAKTRGQKQTVLLFCALLLLTNAWKGHVNFGQCYIFLPFFAALFYAALRWRTSPAGGLLAGLLAASIVLLRPNMFWFVLPFLVLIRRYDRRWLVAFCAAPLLLGAWCLLDHSERDLWLSYSAMLRENVRIHQRQPISTVAVDPDPHIRVWEGINRPHADSLFVQEKDKFTSENGNIFVLYLKTMNRHMPVPVLMTLGLTCIGLVFAGFYRRHRPFAMVSLEKVTLFAYSVYMLSDLFSPIYRHQYYTVQWFFPILLGAAVIASRRWVLSGLLLAGILLNIYHIPHLKMGATIGEFIFLFVLLGYALDSDRKGAGDDPALPIENGSKPQQASVSA